MGAYSVSLKQLPPTAMVGRVGTGALFLLVCVSTILDCGASHPDEVMWEEAPALQLVQAEEAHWHKIQTFLPSFHNEGATAEAENVDIFELLLQRQSLRSRLLTKAKIAGKAAG